MAQKQLKMTPQYTYDNAGKAVGVFLPIDDWNDLKKKYNDFDNELPQWQKEILDKRMELLSQNPSEVTSLDNFIKEMEAEANEQA